VILAKTIKGYGLGEAGEGRNITHQQKKLNEEELRTFRTRFGIPISDDEVADAPFYRPAEDSQEIQYLKERRQALGGYLPRRIAHPSNLGMPDEKIFAEFAEGSGERELSTTMAFVRILGKLLKDKAVGQNIVPIVPDEARTFGMEALFRQVGIYSSVGQLYDPVDSDQLLFYKETKNGQILEEGITEAGSISSFIASGTSYATHGIPTIPFFIFYSMFGMQRVGDLVWAAADMRCRGFLLGATAGRTTLNGEGLQHQDGNSHLLAYPVPNLMAYDPAYAYELEVIIKDGIRRMYAENQDIFYYITVGNENYVMPPMPAGCEEGIVKGGYLFRDASIEGEGGPKARLLGSGAIMGAVLEAQEILQNTYNIPTQVFSITSYKELRREAQECDRWNMLHPTSEGRLPYVSQLLEDEDSVIVAASDYVKTLPDSISPWLENTMISLGTDGFGRSETREALRDHFEVDARFVVLAALSALYRQGDFEAEAVEQAMRDLGIDPDKIDPMTA
jgi:pyruvate dehydrogenase E1 component